MFYALWNTAVKALENEVKFFYIDCLPNRYWCADQGAWGYPTILWRNLEEKTEYKGNEDANQIINFIRENNAKVAAS